MFKKGFWNVRNILQNVSNFVNYCFEENYLIITCFVMDLALLFDYRFILILDDYY